MSAEGRVENQKLNQTAALLSFGWVFGFQLDLLEKYLINLTVLTFTWWSHIAILPFTRTLYLNCCFNHKATVRLDFLFIWKGPQLGPSGPLGPYPPISNFTGAPGAPGAQTPYFCVSLGPRVPCSYFGLSILICAAFLHSLDKFFLFNILSSFSLPKKNI